MSLCMCNVTVFAAYHGAPVWAQHQQPACPDGGMGFTRLRHFSEDRITPMPQQLGLTALQSWKYDNKSNSRTSIQIICQQCCVLAVLQGKAPEGIVSPAASFVSVGMSVHGGGLGSQYGPSKASTAEAQPPSRTQSRPQTRSGSQEAEAEPSPVTSNASPATTSVAVVPGVSHVDDMKGADMDAGWQVPTWGNGTGSSELSALGMTGRSVSSKSGTRRRKVMPGLHLTQEFGCCGANSQAAGALCNLLCFSSSPSLAW